ncbi:probable RNA polymerase II transcription factor B subunit 2 [Saccharomycodes ludwigii]|uniref:RNA polymerase II transcription factor B subunit 2 n=1 Tax=Saccharomycodes ludwigii TaxID=36035 RepID=A0A376B9T1_9ASCO|nr:hypothetical protein SCDLUD_002119 [Saccharomycodes ludwigii]KAH3902300.1 hypothetical protein SCDLUD_002119 [Saccharomycodes ludwigii]SSD61294.1 probable RNA polymerase II transcription factor B subunit 2 [Saccharomycodes ludwigii]
MSTNNLFKATVLEYLEGLSQNVQSRLYESPAACLAIYRILPQLAKFLIMSMVFNHEDVLLRDLNKWVKEQGQFEFDEAIKTMSSLHILKEISKNPVQVNLNPIFKNSFRNSLTGGEVHDSFGIPVDDDGTITTESLDKYAADKWETILHFMVGTPGMKSPSETVLSLLLHSGLMLEEESDYELKITNEGFQFLLQEINVQIWSLLLQYLKMAESIQMDPVEVLNFIFMLGSLELGQSYSVKGLTETQKKLLKDMTDYGLIYQTTFNSLKFYPTRLAIILTSDSMTIRSASMAMNSVLKKAANYINYNDTAYNKNNTANTDADATNNLDKEDADAENNNGEEVDGNGSIVEGALIIETNFKLYSYSNSPLQIAILGLFVHLKTRFANMVAGQVTRESIRRALRNGITAEQIIAYLETHAHPQMVRLAENNLEKKLALDANCNETLEILPPTVVDQIKLWQLELDRITNYDGYLYSTFDTTEEYQQLVTYANDIGVLIWKSDRKKVFFIENEGNSQVVEYAKRLLSRKDSI